MTMNATHYHGGEPCVTLNKMNLGAIKRHCRFVSGFEENVLTWGLLTCLTQLIEDCTGYSLGAYPIAPIVVGKLSVSMIPKEGKWRSS